MDWNDFVKRITGDNHSKRRTAFRRLVNEIGKTAEHIAKSKLGEYQPAIGPYPGWKPLKESTLAEKRAKGFAIPSPLLRTGAMLRSIHAEAKATSTQATVDLSADAPYSIYHELGSGSMRRMFLEPAMWEAVEEMSEAAGECIELALLNFFNDEGQYYVRAEAKLKAAGKRARTRRKV